MMLYLEAQEIHRKKICKRKIIITYRLQKIIYDVLIHEIYIHDFK